MNNVDISRAAALIANDVPIPERVAWCRQVARAQSLDDVPPEWRDRIEAAHRERLQYPAITD